MWCVEEKKGKSTTKHIDFNNITLEEENVYLKAKLAYYEALNNITTEGLP